MQGRHCYTAYWDYAASKIVMALLGPDAAAEADVDRWPTQTAREGSAS